LFIASDVGGHQELIRDGETGMLFRAGDIKALAGVRWKRCIWPMAGSATGCGAAFVEEERNWPRSVADYRAIYGRALGREI